MVGAGEFTPLAEINQIDPIYVYFTISESDLLRVMGKSGRSPLETEQDQGAAVSRSRRTKRIILTRDIWISRPSA